MNATFEECYTRVLTIIRHSPFITMIELDDKVRLGMYYLMKIYGLGFRSCIRANWEWLELCKDDGPALLAQDIEEMPYNPTVYAELKRNHTSGIMPEGFGGQKLQEPPKSKTKDFGWLSPAGDFIEAEWGNHLQAAMDIIEQKGWQEEFDEWEEYDAIGLPENDFLCQVKGYVLIHNPSLDGESLVTQVKPLTKKQREFLYDYFCARGNKLRGEMYLEEGEV